MGSFPTTWTTSPSSVAPTLPLTLPTPTLPLSTRCTGATSALRLLPAPRSLAPADTLPPLATLFAVEQQQDISFNNAIKSSMNAFHLLFILTLLLDKKSLM